MRFHSNALVTEFIPAQKRPGEAILLLVHGRGGRWPLMRWFSKRAAKIEGLDFLCVQAPHDDFVPEMKVPGFSWYLGKNYEGLEQSRAKLQRLISDLQQHYSSQKIFWLGFSQGGAMGLDLAMRAKVSLGGVICVSGFCLKADDYPAEFGRAALQQRILATHGTRDEIVDFERAKESFEKLEKLGVKIDFHSYSKPHSFDLKNEIPFLIETIQSWVKE